MGDDIAQLNQPLTRTIVRLHVKRSSMLAQSMLHTVLLNFILLYGRLGCFMDFAFLSVCVFRRGFKTHRAPILG